ncbi:hypothetical protein ACPCXD_20490 [Rhodococcus sp. AB351]|uniref:hypothetical protein n=1 Tax=Rhodococcus sp. AB351 TaxID=3413280 RepID=UPI003C1A216A
MVAAAREREGLPHPHEYRGRPGVDVLEQVLLDVGRDAGDVPVFRVVLVHTVFGDSVRVEQGQTAGVGCRTERVERHGAFPLDVIAAVEQPACETVLRRECHEIVEVHVVRGRGRHHRQ